MEIIFNKGEIKFENDEIIFIENQKEKLHKENENDKCNFENRIEARESFKNIEIENTKSLWSKIKNKK